MKMNSSVLVVHPDAALAAQWAKAFTDLGFRSLVTDTMIGAIGAIRRQKVDAIVVLTSRADITNAEYFLAEGEDLPLCVVVGGETAAIGVRSRSVLAFDATARAQDMVPCIRSLLTMVVPDHQHRTLPLRAPSVGTACKFTAWLTTPSFTPRASSAW
ncbi:MAG: hypothetical protein KBG15_03170 [Kofleriaceae bacterium]|nr:hypothetical protein [Kofleriaceae bacterium]